MTKYNNKKPAVKQVVKEQAVAYGQKGLRLKLVTGDLIGNKKNKTMFEKISFVRTGITKKFLVRMKEKTNLDYDALAKVLLVGRATLINKNGNKPFNLALSDRIVGLADLYDYGYQVFGGTENFNAWMFSPNKALGGEKPYNLMDTQYGKEEVRHLIGRIEYGVFS